MTIQKNTCTRHCVQLSGGLFVGEDSSLRVSDNARLIVDKIVPSQSDFVLTTMNTLLQYGNVDGRKLEHMPDSYINSPRNVSHERSELELAALARYSLPTTDFSLMIFDGCVLYCGLMFKASSIEAWEEAGLLISETMYPDYWRSWTIYEDEWRAYGKVTQEITSVPERVVELIKMSVIFNSCAYAIEQRSTHMGSPVGMLDVINALIFKSYESVCYGLAAIYDYGHDLRRKNDDLVFAGLLVMLSHDVCEYVRDCYEENYNSTCMILHGLNEDGFSIACAVVFAMWNNMDCFEKKTSCLFRHCISTSLAGNLLNARYCGKERLMECTAGEWNKNVKALAVDIIKQMTGVCVPWPEDVTMTTVSEATWTDYHRMAVTALYESTSDQAADMCIEWANEVVNSTVLRERTVRYVKRTTSTPRGSWA